ncbi:7-carboxy-7-deazaguanine synthase QueE [Ferrimonas balearica]|uniref:7-carboxy-7-deazaguanine synthase QueE n=1 Tax=Ferrimonas balearica TaxID=44012 RepID=UPI001C9958AC|nr:7-carboxy-7-deazaguanine synthase QueE [Ferrimonas balearica]MBY5991061.1 7-carboxy-7-deazaguanine synthase QueE [Ferrimonas balearica]
MHYPVNELFETIQGEGHFTGVPAVFLRLQGCPVGCPWCDTRHTWTQEAQDRVAPDAVIGAGDGQPRWAEWPLEALVAHLTGPSYRARHLVITGGEPCLQDLRPLTERMEAAGWRCQIETSGCFEVRTSADTWVTVSPKIGMKGGYQVLRSALERANEIKHPVAMQKHIDELDALLGDLPLAGKVVALQPISQQHRANDLCVKVCIERNWRLSVQTHKYLNID